MLVVMLEELGQRMIQELGDNVGCTGADTGHDMVSPVRSGALLLTT